jgi:hypothetical protein
MASKAPTSVTYNGYVYVKGTTGVIPGLSKVKEAYKLLKKPKAARQMHPLFARGFDTKLDVTVYRISLFSSLSSLAKYKLFVSVVNNYCSLVFYWICFCFVPASRCVTDFNVVSQTKNRS